MKRRNLFLSLLLAGACAVVGVGYSAITRELKIGGQLAGAKNDNTLKVEYVEGNDALYYLPSPKNTGTNIVVTPTRTNGHAANLDVSGMVDIGDKAEAYFLVKNISQETKNLDATLALPNVIVNNGTITAEDTDTRSNVFKGKHFQITAEYTTDAPSESHAAATGDLKDGGTAFVAAPIKGTESQTAVEGETMWVKVTVELIDVIIVDTFPTHNITISFSASTVADSAASTPETPVNP